MHVVEVTYTSDMHVHDAAQRKLEQHAERCSNLQVFGWQNDRLQIFVIGHTGVMRMRQDNANMYCTILARLGVLPHRMTPFHFDLAIQSLRKSCAIMSCFPSAKAMPFQLGEDPSACAACICQGCTSPNLADPPPTRPCRVLLMHPLH